MIKLEKNTLFSYSSASTYPMKLLLHPELISSCRLNQKVIPLHLQLNPTNKCNFNCPMCSCSARDKNLEMSIDDIRVFMADFKRLGGKSVTITGGGDPAMHSHFQEMVKIIKGLGLDIGLVANGSLMDVIDPVLDYITWFRISSSDSLPYQLKKYTDLTLVDWLHNIHDATVNYPNVDWAFSHVVLQKPFLERQWEDFDLVTKIVRFAVDHDFTHVRLVNDIFKADDMGKLMFDLKEYLTIFEEVDCGKVNFQARSEWTRGMNPCLISLLKPVLGADGFFYPCCGTQYALLQPSRDYEKTMRMGCWTDFEKMIEEQRSFDGSVCVKCYYSNYNLMLDAMVKGLKHENFV